MKLTAKQEESIRVGQAEATALLRSLGLSEREYDLAREMCHALRETIMINFSVRGVPKNRVVPLSSACLAYALKISVAAEAIVD